MSSARRPRILQVASIALGLLAAVTYSDYLVDMVMQPRGVRELAIISHLEAPGAPYSAVLRAFDVAAGVFAVLLSPFLFRALPRGWARWLPVAALVVFGISGALTGLIPDPCSNPNSGCGGPTGAGQRSVHIMLSGWTDLSILACPLLVALVTWRRGPRWVTVSSGVVFVLMVLAGVTYRWHGALDPGVPMGLSQRFVVSLASCWLLLVGLIGAFASPGAAGRSGRDSNAQAGAWLPSR